MSRFLPLKENKTLLSLNLSHNFTSEIGPDAARRLTENIYLNTTLIELKFSGNTFTRERPYLKESIFGCSLVRIAKQKVIYANQRAYAKTVIAAIIFCLEQTRRHVPGEMLKILFELLLPKKKEPQNFIAIRPDGRA